jgi:hypothetical protein
VLFGWLGSILSVLKVIAGAVAAAIASLAAALGLPVWAVVALIAAIAAAIAAIVAFREEIWNFIKNAALAVWNSLKELWATVKEIPGVLWDAIKGALKAAYEWGKNIMMQIAKGIWDFITYPVRAFMALLRRLREMLPFSDPRVGPLRDLSRATRKIGEMVATSMNVKVAMPTLVPTRAPFPPVLSAPAGGQWVYTFHLVTDRQIDAKVQDFVQNRLPETLRMLALGR